jgi:hypothetical protein
LTGFMRNRRADVNGYKMPSVSHCQTVNAH